METRDIDLLRKVDVFQNLTDEHLRRIAPLVTLQHCPAKQVIYVPSEPGSKLYAILTGKVKLTQVSPEGKELVFCVLGRGDVFGELCLFDEGPLSTLATALEDCDIFAIKCSDLANFMAEDPVMVTALGKHIGERIRSLEKKLSDFVFKDVAQRLASLILDLTYDYAETTPSGDHVIEMKITHQDLAGLIGSTRETTTTTLNQFRDKAVIDFQRGRIIVRDIHVLERMAKRSSRKQTS